MDINQSKLYTWETPLGVISGFTFSSDRKKLAYVLNGAAHPPNIWQLDLETRKVKQITSRLENLEQKLVEPDLIHYRSFDHLIVPAFSYKPKKVSGKFPVVIYLHGGPESQSRPTFNPILQYLLNAGYAVCSPNIRGSTGYGKTYTHLDDRRKRMDAVKDLIELAEWLKANEDINPGKMAVMGGSYGGFMTLAAISHYPKYWAAAVSIAGISSIKTFIQATVPWRKKLREPEFGTVEKDGEFFDRLDPIHHTDKIISPLLVIHGENDPRVPIEQADLLVNKLRARNHPVSYLRFENEGHLFVESQNILNTYMVIADFIKKNLG